METQSSNKVLSVSELTSSIKAMLEGNFPNVSVQGEISNFKAQSSGHLYFSLKDKGAQISCVMFKGFTKGLQKMPKIGDQVIVKGDLSVYPPRGGYQLMVRELSFSGLGELLLKLHALKESLKAKGYFDPLRKKSLPLFPKKILVITSPTGAVIQDILHVLERRASKFHLILYPVKVQGDGAAQEIAQAICEANKYNLADVMIIGRGGGSMEDLWAFNEEIVIEEIVKSHIPVVSAVGHETDYTLSDLASDIRAPTPSAAAEIVSQETLKMQEGLILSKKRVAQALIQKIHLSKEKLSSFSRHPLLGKKETLLFPYMQRLDEMSQRLDQSIKQIITEKKLHIEGMKKQRFDPRHTLIQAKKTLKAYASRIDESIFSKLHLYKSSCSAKLLQKSLDQILKKKVEEKKEKCKTLISHLRSINPENLLEKGYAIVFSQKDHSLILDVEKALPDQKIYTRLKGGTIYSTIEKTERNHGRK